MELLEFTHLHSWLNIGITWEFEKPQMFECLSCDSNLIGLIWCLNHYRVLEVVPMCVWDWGVSVLEVLSAHSKGKNLISENILSPLEFTKLLILRLASYAVI